MSGFLRIAGVTLRDFSKTHILSRDIIHEAKAQINIMPAHIRQGSVMDDHIRAKIIADRQRDVDRVLMNLDQRLKALILAMGDPRALDTADITMSRLEGAWQLHQECHRDLANKYDELVYRIRAFARNFAPDVATASVDDVLAIVKNLDQRWRLMQGRIGEVTGALDFKNKQIQELAECLGIKTPVTEPSIFNDIKVRWTDQKSKFNDLQKTFKKEEEERRVASEALKDIYKLMGVAYPDSTSTLTAEIWTRSQRKVSDLEKEFLQEQEKIQQSEEGIQNLTKFFGLPRPLEDGSKILDAIKGKWVQAKAFISVLKSSLIAEKENTCLANETLQGLASFMGVDPTGCESTIVGSMMDRCMKSKREAVDLQSALIEEKEKCRQAHEALQDYLNRPASPSSSISTQTDDHEVQSADLGQVCDKSVQMENSPRQVPHGQILLRKGETFELKTPKSNQGEDIPKPIHEDSLINGHTLLEQSQTYRQHDQESTNKVPISIRRGTTVKLPYDTTVAGCACRGNSNATSNGVCRNAKRYCQWDQSVCRQLQMIEEYPALSISSRGSSQSRSFSSSTGSDRTYTDPSCRSLHSVKASATFSPPSRASLLRGFSSLANTVSDSRPEPSAFANITINKMSDLVPWEESRSRIELGSGVAGTVFLYRHAESKHPVAVKIVENPGRCFRNEVKIHQAISGLPWFPAFYGSFDIAGDQSVLAMEFIGGDSDDRSYTIADCLENTGPILTRDDWFDIFNNVADGLKSLHGCGFLCNDLKEDNVMLVKESGMWQAKIIDFGWASDISTPFVMDLDEEQIENYRNHGGCHHNAPECILEGKPCSTSSDVYALGRLLAFVGQEMDYEDFLNYGQNIVFADQEERPTVQEFIEELYEMQLVGGGEDGPGSSSC